MALTRRTRKRLLFLAILLAGAGLVAAGYHLVVVPGREHRAQRAYEQARQAYEAQDYKGVIDVVGVYLGRHRHDGEALYITADSHFHLAAECSARGDTEGWMKNYRGARDYAMAARAALGEDPRPLELLLVLHFMNREIAEVEEIAALLGESSEEGMAANVHAAIWSGDDREAVTRARRYAEVFPKSAAAQSLYLRCMSEAGRGAAEIAAEAKRISDAYPQQADLAILYAKCAYVVAAEPAAGSDSAALHAAALAALSRVAQAVPDDGGTLAEYFVAADAALSLRGLSREQREQVVAERARLLNHLLEDPERRAWAASTAAAWAWARTGRTADALTYLERVADIPDEAADVALLGWRGACAEAGERREKVIKALEAQESAVARVWRHTLEAIDARLAGDLSKAEQHLDRATAITEAAGVWLPFFEMERAISLSRKSDRAGGARQLRRIVERVPSLVAPRIALYRHLVEEGRTDEALEQARAILELRHYDAEAQYLWSIAAIGAAEAGRPVDITGSVEFLEQLARLDLPVEERPQDWDDVATLIARGRLVLGQREKAIAVIDALRGSTIQIEPSFMVALLRAGQKHGLDDRMSQLAATEGTKQTPALLIEHVEMIARTEGVAAARQYLQSRVESATGADLLAARIARLAFLTARNDDAALEAAAELVNEHPDSEPALTEALGSPAIWTDERLTDRALAELKKFGESEPMYRIFNANRFLTFEYDPSRAAHHIQEINRTLEHDPENVAALRMMAALLLKTGSGIPAGALSHMERAARTGDVNSQFDLVDLLMDAGRLTEARRAADGLRGRSLTEVGPSGLRRRAEMWVRFGEYELAVQDLAALGDEATPADAAQRALLLVDCKKPDEARHIVEQLLDRGLTDPHTARMAAGVLAATGDPLRGRQLLEQIAASNDDPSARIALAEYLAAVGSAAEAASIYEQAVASDGTPETWLRLAACYVQASELEQAREVLSRAPDGELMETARALCSRNNEMFPEVLVRWLHGLADRRTRPQARELAGLIASGADLASFVNANRSFLLGWLELAYKRQAGGDIAGEIQALRSAVNYVPVDPLPTQLLTTRLIDAQRWDEAAAAIGEWRARAGESLLLHLNAAVVADHRRNWRAVVELLEPHQEWIVASGDTRVLTMLGTALAGSRRAADAHELLWPFVEQGVVSPASYAMVAAEAGETMLVRELREWTERIEPRVAANEPALLGAQFRLAIALESTDAEAAEQLYRKVVASNNPQMGPSARNNLAELLRRRGGDLEEALSLARSAVEAADNAVRAVSSPPQHQREMLASCLDTLGLIQLARGEAPDAVTAFERAFSHAPQMVNVRAGLIVSLEKAGRQDDADRYLADGVQRLGPPLQQKVNELRALYGDKSAAAVPTP